MEAVEPRKGLGIASRLRRAKGRPARSRSVAARFTPEEERELLSASETDGKFLAEWAREVLLRESRTKRSEAALFTELTALRLLLSNVLRPVALGEKMTSEQYSQMLTEVRTGKHAAAREVLAQYNSSRPKEQ